MAGTGPSSGLAYAETDRLVVSRLSLLEPVATVSPVPFWELPIDQVEAHLRRGAGVLPLRWTPSQIDAHNPIPPRQGVLTFMEQCKSCGCLDCGPGPTVRVLRLEVQRDGATLTSVYRDRWRVSPIFPGQRVSHYEFGVGTVPSPLARIAVQMAAGLASSMHGDLSEEEDPWTFVTGWHCTSSLHFEGELGAATGAEHGSPMDLEDLTYRQSTTFRRLLGVYLPDAIGPAWSTYPSGWRPASGPAQRLRPSASDLRRTDAMARRILALHHPPIDEPSKHIVEQLVGYVADRGAVALRADIERMRSAPALRSARDSEVQAALARATRRLEQAASADGLEALAREFGPSSAWALDVLAARHPARYLRTLEALVAQTDGSARAGLLPPLLERIARVDGHRAVAILEARADDFPLHLQEYSYNLVADSTRGGVLDDIASRLAQRWAENPYSLRARTLRRLVPWHDPHRHADDQIEQAIGTLLRFPWSESMSDRHVTVAHAAGLRGCVACLEALVETFEQSPTDRIRIACAHALGMVAADADSQTRVQLHALLDSSMRQGAQPSMGDIWTLFVANARSSIDLLDEVVVAAACQACWQSDSPSCGARCDPSGDARLARQIAAIWRAADVWTEAQLLAALAVERLSEITIPWGVPVRWRLRRDLRSLVEHLSPLEVARLRDGIRSQAVALATLDADKARSIWALAVTVFEP